MLGADDYVPKPCTPRELAARLRAILNRVGNQGGMPGVVSAHPIIAGTLIIWPTLRRAENAGKSLNLTSTEFSLLEVLVRQAGRPVSKEELSLKALGRPLSRFERSIDIHVSSIRRKLEPLSDGRSMIQTVIRKGYQLVVD